MEERNKCKCGRLKWRTSKQCAFCKSKKKGQNANWSMPKMNLVNKVLADETKVVRLLKKHFVCGFCNEKFSYKVNLKRHLREIHNTSLDKNPFVQEEKGLLIGGNL